MFKQNVSSATPAGRGRGCAHRWPRTSAIAASLDAGGRSAKLCGAFCVGQSMGPHMESSGARTPALPRAIANEPPVTTFLAGLLRRREHHRSRQRSTDGGNVSQPPTTHSPARAQAFGARAPKRAAHATPIIATSAPAVPPMTVAPAAAARRALCGARTRKRRRRQKLKKKLSAAVS